jgi:UDP-N-acetylglucosamine 1-carboxyvinyltransferase
MDALLIQGPTKLSGEVAVSGSKNTALPFLFASLLFDNEVKFKNIPRLWDIETTLQLLTEMGAKTEWNKAEGTVSILPTIQHKVAPYEWVKKMRAGILALGPLVAKYGEAKVSLPGGCAIGARPVNFHIDALEKMGVSIAVEEGYIRAHVKDRLVGAHIEFPVVTVTGTENLLIVAACADGETTLQNAAAEPEVVALGELLRSAGARIEGLGTSTIRIRGEKLRNPARPIVVPPDRIETGTWISAALATKSELTIEKCDATQLDAVISVFRSMGGKISVSKEGTQIHVEPSDKYEAIELDTHPYPGFPTDMQAQLMVNACFAEGTSLIRETIFENRFMHAAELNRLGAHVTLHGNTAVVAGPASLKAAPIMATDLRASACLVIAALCAQGRTKISRIYHLDRGYHRLDEKLCKLGAEITRASE